MRAIEKEESGGVKMASNAAAPFWRSACANLVRNCLKEPYKSEALTREKVHYSVSKWVDGKPQKPSNASIKKEVKLGNFESRLNLSVHSKHYSQESLASPYKVSRSCLSQDATMVPNFPRRFLTTGATSVDKVPEDASSLLAIPRIKFKRLDKTAAHIMQILDKEAVEEVKARSPIPDIKPGYIIQLKVEVPENKRRVSIVKGIVIARRNAGLNTTFRLRRLVAGVGVENLFHLYSPNIKEMKVLDKKKVRRAKLYYLRDKMNALKKH